MNNWCSGKALQSEMMCKVWIISFFTFSGQNIKSYTADILFHLIYQYWKIKRWGKPQHFLFAYSWKIELCPFNKIAIKIFKAAVPEKLIIYFLALLSIPCVLVFGAVASARAARVASTEEFVWSWLSVTITNNSQIQMHLKVVFFLWSTFSSLGKRPFSHSIHLK